MHNNDSIKNSLPHCRCEVLKNPWPFSPGAHATKCTHLVAYIRTDWEPPSKEEQLNAINEFCRKHDYVLDSIYEDFGSKPGYGLADALARLDRVGGIVAFDLDRFVHNSADRLRDLKPFIHDFFCSTNKHLLTVKEGINTATPGGQRAAIEFISSTKDFA